MTTMVETVAKAKLSVDHSERFRPVSNLYPRCVAVAYRGHGGIRQAARDSDRQVAKMVAAWERRHGMPVRNWVVIGRREGKGVRRDRG